MAITTGTTAAASVGASGVTADALRKCEAFVETGTIDPLFAGAVVGVVSLGLHGIVNSIAAFKNEKTGKDAALDTLKDSGKTSLSTVVGIVTGNVVASVGLVIAAPAVLPIAAAVTTTFITRNIWDKATRAKQKTKPRSATKAVRLANANA